MHKGNVIPVQTHSRLMHWYRWQPYQIPFFNSAARFAMSCKHFLEPKIIQQQLKTADRAIDNFYQTQSLFFVFSTIRSGSTFLTDLFSQELQNVQVEHEPNINDYWSYTKVLRDQRQAKKYVHSYRKKDIYHRWDKQSEMYGEFNPFLLLHCTAIKEEIPQAKIFHLVRDGRDVVRSIMSREVLGHKDPLSKRIRPPQGDPYFDAWVQMTRFEKVCWKWQYENRVIRQSTNAKWHFEKVISDFAYFENNLLQTLNIPISKTQWQKHVNQPKHASPQHELPHWKHWTKEQKVIFKNICKKEMNECGYELNWSNH